MFISALKWWLLLRAAEQPVAYLWTVRTYLVGQFFSNFLPTSIGGDAVRVFRLNQLVGRLGLAIASVFVERITGFLALTIIGWVALGLNFDRFGDNWQLRWAMIWGLLAASGGLAAGALGTLDGGVAQPPAAAECDRLARQAARHGRCAGAVLR